MSSGLIITMIFELRRSHTVRDDVAAGDETWTSLVAESTAQQWTVVQNLESGVTYEVKVIAAVDGAYCLETQTAVRRVDIDVRRGFTVHHALHCTSDQMYE